MKEKNLYTVISIVALLGVINAGYLAWTAIMGSLPTCNFLHGCAAVATSSYSKIFGIPLSVFGFFFYLTILGFSVWKVFVKSAPALLYLFPLTIIGFLLSLYFLYLQAFIIQAYCEYCLFSLFDATVLFLLTGYLWMKRKEAGKIEETQP